MELMGREFGSLKMAISILANLEMVNILLLTASTSSSIKMVAFQLDRTTLILKEKKKYKGRLCYTDGRTKDFDEY